MCFLYLLSFFFLFDHFVCFLKRYRKRKGAKFGGWAGGEDLGRIAVNEMLIRIYCIYFLQ